MLNYHLSLTAEIRWLDALPCCHEVSLKRCNVGNPTINEPFEDDSYNVRPHSYKLVYKPQ